MGKEIFLNRYAAIVRRLEKGPASFSQIEHYLLHVVDIDDKPTNSYSIRTLQRDIKDIEKLFNIAILNERKGDKRYYIADKPDVNLDNTQSQKLLESYQIINAINKYPDFEKYVVLEKRQPNGIQHFYYLLQAIQQRKVVVFEHFNYKNGKTTQRTVYPLALKESKRRWYVMAIDTNDNKLKTFGLDRMQFIEALKQTFKKRNEININEIYNDAYGVIVPDDKALEKVLIKCTTLQADYLKSFPLHHSQKIEQTDKTSVNFSFNIYITYDFIEELLSYGQAVEVLAPLSLRNKMKEILTNALKQY